MYRVGISCKYPAPRTCQDRILGAVDNPTMDHRSPDFGKLGLDVPSNLRTIFQTKEPVIIYPASGTGAWEVALTNKLSPGDTVLMCRTGRIAHL